MVCKTSRLCHLVVENKHRKRKTHKYDPGRRLDFRADLFISMDRDVLVWSGRCLSILTEAGHFTNLTRFQSGSPTVRA